VVIAMPDVVVDWKEEEAVVEGHGAFRASAS
jgi:hypothetical protein